MRHVTLLKTLGMMVKVAAVSQISIIFASLLIASVLALNSHQFIFALQGTLYFVLWYSWMWITLVLGLAGIPLYILFHSIHSKFFLSAGIYTLGGCMLAVLLSSVLKSGDSVTLIIAAIPGAVYGLTYGVLIYLFSKDRIKSDSPDHS